MSDRDRIVCWVRVVVEIDGEDHVLGSSLWMIERGEDPQAYAAQMLKVWDEAREQSEKTLRLYGAEGIARELTAVAPVLPTEPEGN